jgi:hypothetical protein
VEHTSREEHEEAETCERKRQSFENLGATSDVGLEAFAGLRCCGAGPRVRISKAMDTLRGRVFTTERKSPVEILVVMRRWQGLREVGTGGVFSAVPL